jgi:hypothetical protein
MPWPDIVEPVDPEAVGVEPVDDPVLPAVVLPVVPADELPAAPLEFPIIACVNV